MMIHLGVEHCLKAPLHHRSKQGVEFTDRGRIGSELGGQLFGLLFVGSIHASWSPSGKRCYSSELLTASICWQTQTS